MDFKAATQWLVTYLYMKRQARLCYIIKAGGRCTFPCIYTCVYMAAYGWYGGAIKTRFGKVVLFHGMVE